MLQIILILSIIFSTIMIGEYTPSIKQVFLPCPIVFISTCKFKNPFSTDKVLFERTYIGRAIRPVLVAFYAMFLSIFIVTFIVSTICPNFFPKSKLHIIFPLTFLIRTIWITIPSLSLRIPVYPIPFIELPIGLKHPTFSIAHICCPLTFVKRAIGIGALTPSPSLLIHPLS